MLDFVIRGSRGTMARSDPQFMKYGGNTTCLSVHTDQGVIIVDAGTGICGVGQELLARPVLPSVALLFTHFHMDHLMGLPGFEVLYTDHLDLTIMANPKRAGWQTTLRTFMGKPYWPVGLGECVSPMRFQDLPTDGGICLYGIDVTWRAVPHPQDCLAYRFHTAEGDVVFATDVEYERDAIDPGFIDFCRDAAILIMDAQYTPQEYPAHRGWGHSTWEVAARVAGAAGVGRLVLTHHDPGRSDDAFAPILEGAAAAFTDTVLATERMTLSPGVPV